MHGPSLGSKVMNSDAAGPFEHSVWREDVATRLNEKSGPHSGPLFTDAQSGRPASLASPSPIS